MKHWISLLAITSTLLLTACATTIRSEVTAFNDWPQALQDKSYRFEQNAAQENDLEYRRYETLVREQLGRLGFHGAEKGSTAQLKVTLAYGIDSHEVTAIEAIPVGPSWYGVPPYYGRGWRGGFYGPFYDPFWYQPMMLPREVHYQLFMRHLQITIASAHDGKKLYDVRVRSEGRIDSLPRVMPVMIRAAFANFPGPNGVPQQIDLKLE